MSNAYPPRIAIAAASEGSRLHQALRAASAGLSQQRARTLCDIGAVAIDGVLASGNARVHAGDVVLCAIADLELTLRLRLPVVHRSGGVLVLRKPPHLAVHAGPRVDDCVADRLARALPGAGLAQRLDRHASGLLLCGEHRDALAALGAAMEQGRIERHYLGIAAGRVDGDERTIDLPLFVSDEPQGDRPKVVVDAARGQRAVTHLQVVARARDATLVRLRLETGRTHQIRAHLRAVGHPLLGDPRYGDAAANAAAHRTHGVDRALLHCERLRLPALGSAPACDVATSLEPDFARLFPQLRARDRAGDAP